MKKFVCVLVVFAALLADIAAQDVAVFPQLGHSTKIQSVVFSPDEKHILSGSLDKTIKLWDVANGREIKTFLGHTDSINSASFSPDGKQVLSGSHDKTIKLWDVASGREIRTFLGHTDSISSVSFSPDGKQILSSSRDKTIKLWDTSSGKEIKTFVGHTDTVNSVCFSSDGKQILSGSNDKSIKLWDVVSGQEITNFLGHTKQVYSVVFSHNGRQILSGSEDETIKLWDVYNGQEIKTFSGYIGETVAFSPDGKYILSGSYNTSSFILWDIDSGKEIWKIKNRVVSACFSSDGNQILSAGNSIILWDVESGHEIKTFSGHAISIGSVSFNYNEKQFISVSGIINLWDIVSGHQIKTIQSYQMQPPVMFSPDGKYVLSRTIEFGPIVMYLWDGLSDLKITSFSSNIFKVTSANFSSDGKQIISGFEDGTMRLWDTSSGRLIRTFSGHTKMVSSVCFSPDGKQILSSSWDTTIRLWDVSTGREIKTFSWDINISSESTKPYVIIPVDMILRGFENYVHSVSFSPDGKQILSSFEDGIVRLWDISSGQIIKTFSGHTSWVYSVCFNPDGKQILSGSGDSTINIWDVVSGQEIRTFSGHTGEVTYIEYIFDGKYIISASNDGTTRLWDVATGKEIAQFISFIGDEWIVITPDGYYNSSPKGDQYLNVRIGNEVYGMDQFAKIFYQPEVVERRLQGLPDPDYVKPGVSIQTASIPPALKVTHGEVDPITQKVTLTITAIDAIRQISDIEIIINGRLLGAKELQIVSAKNLKVTNTRLVTSSAEKQYEFKITLQLDPGLNRIEIVAANDANFGLAPITIGVPESTSKKGADKKGDLYVLAIGVNKYAPDPDWHSLEYAVSDSKRIVDSFRAQQGKRFNKVYTLRIADNEKIKPTKKNILANLAFLKKAGPNDVALLFVAAHGKTEDGIYYFLPSDTIFTGNAKFDVNSAVNIGDLIQALDIPCRKIVLLDTCESGGVDNNRLVHNLRNRSTVIFTASQEDESAREKEKIGGYFTYEITRGLKGGLEEEAAEDGVVLLNTLGEYVIERVGRMSFRRQKPVKLIPDGFKDFIISVIK